MPPLDTMLVSAVRYALTCHNYVVSETVNFLLEYGELSNYAKNIMTQDIRTAFRQKQLVTQNQQQQWGRLVKAWNIKL